MEDLEYLSGRSHDMCVLAAEQVVMPLKRTVSNSVVCPSVDDVNFSAQPQPNIEYSDVSSPFGAHKIHDGGTGGDAP